MAPRANKVVWRPADASLGRVPRRVLGGLLLGLLLAGLLGACAPSETAAWEAGRDFLKRLADAAQTYLTNNSALPEATDPVLAFAAMGVEQDSWDELAPFTASDLTYTRAPDGKRATLTLRSDGREGLPPAGTLTVVDGDFKATGSAAAVVDDAPGADASGTAAKENGNAGAEPVKGGTIGLLVLALVGGIALIFFGIILSAPPAGATPVAEQEYTDVAQRRLWRLLQAAFVLGILALAVMFIQRGHDRIDLTQDKRYSLLPVSIGLLEQLRAQTDPFQVRYYYSPANIRPTDHQLLPGEIEDLLEEYQQYAPDSFRFELIEVQPEKLTEEEEGGAHSGQQDTLRDWGWDVDESVDESKLTDAQRRARALRKSLREQGISLAKETTREGGVTKEVEFYSALFIRFRSVRQVTTVQLPANKRKAGFSMVDLVDDALTRTLDEAFRASPARVAFLTGHDQPEQYMSKLREALRERRQFRVSMVNLAEARRDATGGIVDPLAEVDVLVIMATPKAPTDRDLWEIDRFVMRGGNILFVTNPLAPSSGRFGMAQPMASQWSALMRNYGFQPLKDRLGVSYEPAVYDERCWDVNDRLDQAPQVKDDGRKDHPILAGILELQLLRPGGIGVQPDAKLKKPPRTGSVIIQSSRAAWYRKLSPFGGRELKDESSEPKPRGRYPYGAVLAGRFPSYFAGKAVPAVPDASVPAPTTSGAPGMPDHDDDGFQDDGANAPADNQPADNAPADNAPADNQPADNAPADNAPADNAPADNAPAAPVPAYGPEPPGPPSSTADGRMVAIANNFLFVDMFDNHQFLLASIDWLAHGDRFLALRGRSGKVRELIVPGAQRNTVAFWTIVSVPLVLLILAVMRVWYRHYEKSFYQVELESGQRALAAADSAPPERVE